MEDLSNNARKVLNRMFQSGDVVSRRKGPVMHRGVVMLSGDVLHNTPFQGVHVSTQNEFSKNKRVKASELPRNVRQATLSRLSKAEDVYRSYNPFTNNCEHTVTRLTQGNSSSPQLKGILIGAAVGAVGLLLTRSPSVAICGFLVGKNFATRRQLSKHPEISDSNR